MSVVAAAGAVSLATRERPVPLARRTVMMKPPPIPIDCEVTTPLQNKTAMAASTAVPFCLRMSLREKMLLLEGKMGGGGGEADLPTTAQGLESTATAAWWKCPSSLTEGAGGLRAVSQDLNQ